MQNRPAEWQAFVSEIYRASLFLYPKSFRRQFGSEMHQIFRDALKEQAQGGLPRVFTFLGREILEAPAGILDQHFQLCFRRRQPYLMSMLAFAAGFILLGIIDELKFRQIFSGSQPIIIDAFGLFFTGGVGGLAIGYILRPGREMHFAFCGAVGFLLARIALRPIFTIFFPYTFSGPYVGAEIFTPFLYAILEGCIYGLFLGMGTGKWHWTFRLAFLGGLAMFVGFFINRLSAALIQSYVVHDYFTGWSAVLVFVIVPYLLEGMLLGVMFGKGSQGKVAVNTEAIKL